jgi:hypothetical protein
MSGQSWKVEGQYFESCNCEVLCPCLLTHAQARPTEGHCDVVLAFHIDKGSYGSTDLSGLNAVQAVMTPGPMAQGNGTFALYLDSRATAEQRSALEAIFGGSAGGPPAFVSLMAPKRLPTKVAEMNFSADGNVRKLSMPGIAEVTVEGVLGSGGNTVWIDNAPHPLTSRVAAAKGTSSNYSDHSLTFKNSGRNGHFAPISWSNG